MRLVGNMWLKFYLRFSVFLLKVTSLNAVHIVLPVQEEGRGRVQLMWGVGTMRGQVGEVPLQPTSGYFVNLKDRELFFFLNIWLGGTKI